MFPPHIISLISSSSQELRSWEEALARAAEEQREQEEQLRRREQELAEREIDIVERELNIIIHQVYQEKPSVKKRKGHFKKSRLLKLGRDSNCISLPSGGWWVELRGFFLNWWVKSPKLAELPVQSHFLLRCIFIFFLLEIWDGDCRSASSIVSYKANLL